MLYIRCFHRGVWLVVLPKPPVLNVLFTTTCAHAHVGLPCASLTFFSFFFSFFLFFLFFLSLVGSLRFLLTPAFTPVMAPFRRPRSAGRRGSMRRKRRKVALPVRIVKKHRRRRLTGTRRSGLLPQGKVVSVSYFFTNTLDLAAGTHATHVYSANGAFDPDVTGGGHQPRGFDQWASLYTKYTVMSSKITCKAQSPTNVQPYVLSIRTQFSGEANDVDPETIFELHGNRYSSKPSHLETCKTVKHACIPRRFVDNSVESQDHLAALFSANPVTNISYKITAARLGAAAGGNVRIWGTITYKLKLLEPKKTLVS